MAWCNECAVHVHDGSVEVAVDDIVEDTPVLPLRVGRLDERSSRRVAALFKRLDRQGDGRITAESILIEFGKMGIQITESEAAGMLKAADRNYDGYVDFPELIEWLCRCRVQERWEEGMRDNLAFECMILLFDKARSTPVTLESTALGPVFDLEVPSTAKVSDLVLLMEKAASSADPLQQALKFRDIMTFAKRITGDCLGLLDSSVRYRENLWKAMEGNRSQLGFEGDPDAVDNVNVDLCLDNRHSILFVLDGAVNLARLYCRALYMLHAVNHLFKKLRTCRGNFVAALERQKEHDKASVETFFAVSCSCEKLAYFEKELAAYEEVAAAWDAIRASTAVDTDDATAKAKMFLCFKEPWKQMKEHDERTRRLAEGYDSWALKLWSAMKQMMFVVYKKYNLEVPGGHDANDQEATASIPLRKGFRPLPKFKPSEG